MLDEDSLEMVIGSWEHICMFMRKIGKAFLLDGLFCGQSCVFFGSKGIVEGGGKGLE